MTGRDGAGGGDTGGPEVHLPDAAPVCLADWCDAPSTGLRGGVAEYLIAMVRPAEFLVSSPTGRIRGDRCGWLTDPSRRVPPRLVVLARHPCYVSAPWAAPSRISHNQHT